MASFIPLSVPNFQGNEKEYVNEAVVSEWVSTGGSKVGDFENAIAHYVGMPRSVACNSGSSCIWPPWWRAWARATRFWCPP